MSDNKNAPERVWLRPDREPRVYAHAMLAERYSNADDIEYVRADLLPTIYVDGGSAAPSDAGVKGPSEYPGSWDQGRNPETLEVASQPQQTPAPDERGGGECSTCGSGMGPSGLCLDCIDDNPDEENRRPDTHDVVERWRQYVANADLLQEPVPLSVFRHTVDFGNAMVAELEQSRLDYGLLFDDNEQQLETIRHRDAEIDKLRKGNERLAKAVETGSCPSGVAEYWGRVRDENTKLRKELKHERAENAELREIIDGIHKAVGEPQDSGDDSLSNAVAVRIVKLRALVPICAHCGSDVNVIGPCGKGKGESDACELNDGGWVCSEACWDAVADSGVEGCGSEESDRHHMGDSTGGKDRAEDLQSDLDMLFDFAVATEIAKLRKRIEELEADRE